MKNRSIILGYFPRLRNDNAFLITSKETRDYNCIAWASGVNTRWEWPPLDNVSLEEDEYWPTGIENSVRIEAFVKNFESKGFVLCSNEALEPGFQKVALFAIDGICTHASLQLSNETWTSKLGFLNDITHSLHALEGDFYGRVVCILKKQINCN